MAELSSMCKQRGLKVNKTFKKEVYHITLRVLEEVCQLQCTSKEVEDEVEQENEIDGEVTPSATCIVHSHSLSLTELEDSRVEMTLKLQLPIIALEEKNVVLAVEEKAALAAEEEKQP
ncbi:hypothetical protein NDU88_008414 [Pleurodeles waltl]|uniref:Uncharacterized protein n=1 Tax=Pleurodeles waltl TaxID=8319 RepID=A0AAV7QNG9_PLEWA|nr:hypothetical protein NDU88_008414 [Pleurodeles waltl]